MTEKDIKTLSDAELLLRFKEGNNDALGLLFSKYMHLAYGVALKYLRNPEDSRDAIMNVFEKLHTDLLRHEVQNFKSWLHTVVRNHCLMEIRKNKGMFSVQIEESIKHNTYVESVHSLHPDGESSREEQLVLLEKGINTLNNKQKTCIELFYIQQYSYKEIADNTGLTLLEIKSNIQNGKRNLKLFFDQQNEI